MLRQTIGSERGFRRPSTRSTLAALRLGFVCLAPTPALLRKACDRSLGSDATQRMTPARLDKDGSVNSPRRRSAGTDSKSGARVEVVPLYGCHQSVEGSHGKNGRPSSFDPGVLRGVEGLRLGGPTQAFCASGFKPWIRAPSPVQARWPCVWSDVALG